MIFQRPKWKPRMRDVATIDRVKLNDGRTCYRITSKLSPDGSSSCFWRDTRMGAFLAARRHYDEYCYHIRPHGIASEKTIYGKR